MSSLGGIVSSMGAMSGDKGSYSGVDVVKSPKIQGLWDSLIGNYQSQMANDSTSLNQYIKDYLAGNPDARKNTAQETGAINRYYNGDVERQLAAMRGNQATLGQEAVNRAIAEHRGNINRAVMGGGGGGDSSYLNRIGTGMAADYDLKNRMDLLNQERGDYNAVNAAQLGLTGKRTALADAYTGRQLVPMQLGQQNFGWDTGMLQSLQGINNANNQYGVIYNPSQTELAGNVTSAVGGSLMDLGSMAGGMGGGRGGGGGDSSAALAAGGDNEGWAPTLSQQQNYGGGGGGGM